MSFEEPLNKLSGSHNTLRLNLDAMDLMDTHLNNRICDPVGAGVKGG